MNALIALLPIVLIIFLMVGLRWSAVRAGAAGYLCALLLAWVWFGAEARLLAYAHGRALLLSLDVLLIIWAAFLLYRVADEAGAIRTIGQALPHLTPDRSMQALLIGWLFASFLQGVGGFGVPVAVTAPVLVGLGFSPLASVIIPSLGHGWSVTFGSLGSSFQALMAATGRPDQELVPYTALFLGCSAPVIGWMAAHAAGGWIALRRLWSRALLLGVVMGGVQAVVALAGLWHIGAFTGSLAGLLAAFPLARSLRSQTEHTGSPQQKLEVKALLVALSGYLVLVIVTLAVQLTPAVRELLGQVTLQVKFPEVSTSMGYLTPAGFSRKIPLLRHAGTLLVVSSLLAYAIYRRARLYKPGAVRRILLGTYQRVLPSSLSIASMVAMAVVMENSGMTEALARGLAEGVGAAFPLASPWIGALGAFMTGSNTNSNVLFGALQLRTAELLNLAPAVILAAQTSGAALASVIAPSKVVVGTSTAGMAGQEGEVMRHMLGYVVILLTLVSILAASILSLAQVV